MDTTLPNKEEETVIDNVIDLNKARTSLGGGGSTTNWLVDLPVGSVFYIQAMDDRSNFMLLQLEKVQEVGKVVRLWDRQNDRLFGDVDPQRFVARYRKYADVEETEIIVE